MESLTKCLVTGIDLSKNAILHDDRPCCFGYKVTFGNKNFEFWFSNRLESWIDNEKKLEETGQEDIVQVIEDTIGPHTHIIIGLLFESKWKPDKTPLTKSKVLEIIDSFDYPKSPKEKLDNLLNRLFLMNDEMFSYIDPSQRMGQLYGISIPYYKCMYFVSIHEFRLYMNTLIKKGFINTDNKQYWDAGASRCQVSYEGMNYIIDLSESGRFSRICFVAMSFDEEDYPIFRDAIRPACSETSFEAVRIDYSHYDSDKTINDAMIAFIKKSRFMIADFTSQKHNVYFEAGYALGRGMKVIYTCKEDDFKYSSFNTNHFPHVTYKNTEDLKKKLVDKIGSFILD